MRGTAAAFLMILSALEPAGAVEYYAVTGTIRDTGSQLDAMWVQNPQQVCQPFLPNSAINKSIITERINNYGTCGAAPTTKIITR